MENRILILELFEELADLEEELSPSAIEALANALVSVFETKDIPYIQFSHDRVKSRLPSILGRLPDSWTPNVMTIEQSIQDLVGHLEVE